MKLYHDDDAADILARRGLLLSTVDCRVCGETFVPHLVWPDSPPETAGLCEKHFQERIANIPVYER